MIGHIVIIAIAIIAIYCMGYLATLHYCRKNEIFMYNNALIWYFFYPFSWGSLMQEEIQHHREEKELPE